MSNQPTGTNRSMGMGRGGISLRNLKTFTSFKNPVFRIYFGSMVGMMAGMNMQQLVGSLLIYRITGSAAILGVMALASAIPMLFLSLFGGVIADRMQKKYVMFAGMAGSALVSLGVALSLTLGYLSVESAGSWWILFVAGVFNGTIFGLMLPSRQSIVREIVSQDQLMNAVSLNMLTMSALRLLAPAASGFLIDAFDFAAVYYVMTGLYLVSIVFNALLPRTSTITIGGRSALADINEGLQYIRRETTILFILLFTLVAVVLSMPYQMLLPIFTEDILKVGAKGMGIVMSVAGIGAILGSLFLASLPNKKRGVMLLVSSLILGIALTGFSFSSSWVLSLCLIAVVGLGQTGRMALANTLLQYYSVDEYQGRVMSIMMLEFGLSSFATFGAALLTEAIGVQWAVGGFAIVLVLISILALVFVPRLRRLD
ncbi:MAG: MFS transporter [Dehalococcoidales bacterium]|nr:MFS transporter [Dehalococcoidales bacterium]